MVKRCSVLGEVSLGAVFFIMIAGVLPIAAQTTSGDTRSRLHISPNDGSTGTSTEKQPPVGSAAANAKAKKLYKTGVEYGNADLFRQAAEVFQLAVKLKPDYPDAHRGLGHAYIDLGLWEQAVEPLEQALRLNPKDKDARRLLEEAWVKVTITSNEPPKAFQPIGTRVGLTETKSTSPTSAAKIPENELELINLYRVGPGDVLDVILGTATTADSTGNTVTTSGLLIHPSLTEPLSVAGLSVEEIAAKFEGAHQQQGPTGNVKVSVGIREYVSHTILVSGLVKDPGAKILRREAIPLAVVLADAQPLPDAGRVTIVRNKSNESFTIDLTQPTEMIMLVHSGDVITLVSTPPQFFYIAGEVKTPGEKTFRRGLTLTQAIFIGGGPIGKAKEVRVSRNDGKGFLIVHRYKLAEIDSGKLPDPLIVAGDRIMVIN